MTLLEIKNRIAAQHLGGLRQNGHPQAVANDPKSHETNTSMYDWIISDKSMQFC